MIDSEALRQINYVIERDATSSTYKFVLLKSVINACQKFEHLIVTDDTKANIPIGLIVEQWVFDYMPFVFKNIVQQHSGNILDTPIEKLYHEIFDALGLNQDVEWEYAFMQFRKAYESSSKSFDLARLFVKLSKKIATKIVTMPMRYIGQEQYQLFQPELMSFGRIIIPIEAGFNTGVLINTFGYFSISVQHYQIYRYFGQTLYGTSTIISKWKEKTRLLNIDQTLHRDMIDKLSNESLEVRDTTDIRSILEGEQECVWSGKTIQPERYDIDHVLPFSLWFNNDLWNMLPSDRQINQHTKRDKIPTPKLIEKRSDVIKHYWDQYSQEWPHLFKSQMELSLSGQQSSKEQLTDNAIESLCRKCHYLIVDRGHEKFEL